MQSYGVGQSNDTGCPANYNLVTDPKKITQLNADNKTNLNTKRALAGPQPSTLYSGMNYVPNSKGGWCELKNIHLSDGVSSEDIAGAAHSILTVVELTTLALAFIPTPL